MEDRTKVTYARWLIFIAVFVSMTMVVYTEYLVDIYPNLKQFGPHSLFIDLLGLTLCAIFLTGLYMGSRGLGIPLSFGLLITLLFSNPSRIILVPYIILNVLAVIYYEFFW